MSMAMTIDDVMAYLKARKSAVISSGFSNLERKARLAELTALEMHIMARERAGEGADDSVSQSSGPRDGHRDHAV